MSSLDVRTKLVETLRLDLVGPDDGHVLAADLMQSPWSCDDFRRRQWPGPTLPRLFYDPRALDLASAFRASLHAKVLIVDRRAALVTSANFTEAAQRRNIETGVLITHPPFVTRLADTFAGLQQHLFVELK